MSYTIFSGLALYKYKTVLHLIKYYVALLLLFSSFQKLAMLILFKKVSQRPKLQNSKQNDFFLSIENYLFRVNSLKGLI